MRVRWLIAAAIIAALFALQSFRRVRGGPWGVDGSYYMQVARHIADGEGIRTSVSLYDQGLRSLPARTNIYPLWPICLGLAAKVVSLESASTLLPRLLFVLDLGLLFTLANRISGSDRFDGHAAVLLLGVNPSFFSNTCYPYTDGLALGLCFAALIALDLALRKNRVMLYALSGAIAGLAFLTRSQMLLLGGGIGVVLVAAALRRVTAWPAVAAFSSGFVIAVLPWILYLATFIRPLTLSAFVGMYSDTPGLPAFDQHVHVAGALSYAIDRLGGLAVMFNPLSPLSFVHTFGIAALLVPVGFAWALWRRRWMGGLLSAATATAGLLLIAVLLDAHNRFFLEWLFGYRHGLPFILLLVAALIQMREPVIRVIALAVVVVSVGLNIPRIVAFAEEAPPPWPSIAQTELAGWLARYDPRAIVLTTDAQSLSVISRANFRWAACEQTPEQIERVLRLVRTDYVLLYEQERRCPFAQGVQRDLKPAAVFGTAPNRLLLLRVHS